MNGLMILIVGFVAGCVIASGVWAVLWALSKKDRHEDKPGVEIMKEIASECAEIENSIVSESMKKISKADFQSNVSPRLEKITKKLSTNMDSFDVYYVKYIETLITRYRSTLLPSDTIAQPVPDIKATAAPVEKEAEIIVSKPEEKKAEAPIALMPDPENFDQTWQMDLSKHGPERARFEKNASIILENEKDREPPREAIPEETFQVQPTRIKPAPAAPLSAQEMVEETVFDRLAPDMGMKDTKIIKTENIPEEKQSEIEKIIIAELNREPADKKEQTPAAEAGARKKAKGPIPKFEDAKEPKTAILPEKIVEKEAKPSPAATQKDDNFISGEDLVAKLDSFFGI